jgi:hypothetical protein
MATAPSELDRLIRGAVYAALASAQRAPTVIPAREGAGRAGWGGLWLARAPARRACARPRQSG